MEDLNFSSTNSRTDSESASGKSHDYPPQKAAEEVDSDLPSPAPYVTLRRRSLRALGFYNPKVQKVWRYFCGPSPPINLSGAFAAFSKLLIEH